MTDRRAIDVLVGGTISLQIFNSIDVLGPVSVADLALLVAIVGIGIDQIRRDDLWLAPGLRPILIVIPLLMVWLLVAGDGWHLTQILGFTIVIGLIGIYARSIDDIDTLLWGAVIGATVGAILTVYSIFIDPSFGGRVAGTRGIGPIPELPYTIGLPGSFNPFATFLLAPFPFALIHYRIKPTRLRLFLVGIIATTLVLLRIRAVYLGVITAIGVLFLGLYARQVWRWSWANVGVALGSLGVLGGIALGGAFMLYQVSPQSVNSRLQQYHRSLDLIVSHPVYGVRPPIIQHFERHVPHNLFLQLGVVGGIPTIILFVVILLSAGIGLWRGFHDTLRTRRTALAVAAGMAGVLVSLSFAPGFTRILWVFIGIGGVFVNMSGRNSKMENRHQSLIGILKNTAMHSRTVEVLMTATPGLKNATTNSYAIEVLMKDATRGRIKIETAWGQSQTRKVCVSILNTWTSSRIKRLLFEA